MLNIDRNASHEKQGNSAAKVEPTVCEYIPEAVAYMVARAHANTVMTTDDFACLRELADYYREVGGIHGFLRTYDLVTRDFDRLLRKCRLLLDDGDGAADLALRDCMDMLVEWEFLRFDRNVIQLDAMLLESGLSIRSLRKWRRQMIGFNFIDAAINTLENNEQVA